MYILLPFPVSICESVPIWLPASSLHHHQQQQYSLYIPTAAEFGKVKECFSDLQNIALRSSPFETPYSLLGFSDRPHPSSSPHRTSQSFPVCAMAFLASTLCLLFTWPLPSVTLRCVSISYAHVSCVDLNSKSTVTQLNLDSSPWKSDILSWTHVPLYRPVVLLNPNFDECHHCRAMFRSSKLSCHSCLSYSVPQICHQNVTPHFLTSPPSFQTTH